MRRSRTIFAAALAAAVLLVALATGIAGAVTVAKPTALAATPTSSTAVHLQWKDASTNERGFEIQRSLAAKTAWHVIATAAANATSYDNTGLTPATAYKYRVRAQKPGSGASSYSNTATATTPGGATTTTTSTTSTTTTSTTTTTVKPGGPVLPVVGGLRASGSSCANVVASWSPVFDPNNNYHLTQYRLYRNGALARTVAAPATTVVDANLSPNTTYSYTVTMVDNANHESAKSPAVSATTTACQPAAAWGFTVGGAGAEMSTAVAIDPAGNTAVTGSFGGTANFGNGPETASTPGDIFVARYSSTHQYLWAKHYKSSETRNETYDVATDATGNVFVAGAFFGTLDLGGPQPLVNGQKGMRDGFVAKYSPTGALLWAKQFGGTLDDSAMSVALDTAGNPVFAGYFRGKNIDFAGAPLSSGVFGGNDTFVVKLSSATGASMLAFATPCGNDSGWDVAVGADNSIAIVGSLSVACTIGSSSITQNNIDVFVAKYSATGTPLWARAGGGIQQDKGVGVAMDPSGNVFITGLFAGVVDFGTGSIGQAGSLPEAALVKYSSTGTPVWSKAFSSSGPVYGNSLVADAHGNVTLAGTFYGAVDFGGATLTVPPPLPGNAAGSDAFVAQYSPTGSLIAANRYGDDKLSFGTDVTLGPAGAVVTGSFTSTVDLGWGPVSAVGSSDFFVLNTGR